MASAVPDPALQVPVRPIVPRWPRLAAAILPVATAAAVASVSTRAGLPVWYAALNKPSFNPPDWAFPIAWTLLYAMIAVALWRLLGAMPRTGPSRRGWWLALAAFLVQIVLNAAWAPVFFSAHAVGIGLVVVATLLVTVLWTIRLTWRFDRPAAWLLVPYGTWVAFATLLNAAILRLN